MEVDIFMIKNTKIEHIIFHISLVVHALFCYNGGREEKNTCHLVSLSIGRSMIILS